MSQDMQQHYKNLGYRLAGDGAVEFYYVAMRTHKTTKKVEICLCGLFSWSGDQHDPAISMQKQHEDNSFSYTRAGPFPTRQEAEQRAVDYAIKVHGDPTSFGILGTGGLNDIDAGEGRAPGFR